MLEGATNRIINGKNKTEKKLEIETDRNDLEMMKIMLSDGD